MRKNTIIIMTSMFMFSLFQSPVWANVCPKPEVANVYLISIPLAILSVYLINPKFNWINLAFFVLFSWNNLRAPNDWPIILFVGWVFLSIVARMREKETQFNWGIFIFLVFIRFENLFHNFGWNQLLELIFAVNLGQVICEIIMMKKEGRRERINLKRFICAIILAIIFISVSIVTISSRSYSEYYSFHHRLMDNMITMVKKIGKYRDSNLERDVPTEFEFGEMLKGVPRYGRGAFARDLKYVPSEDRQEYTLYYAGEGFRKNAWYILPPGYPRYSSKEKLIPGKRMKLKFALYKKYVLKCIR
ncbi:MAG: hypothetical protein K8T10_17430 [Candidatus Eremiobacteraeota bacterium]|nr:hypothetical protein [Candidatus Eremiobacteraeota bacterium]